MMVLSVTREELPSYDKHRSIAPPQVLLKSCAAVFASPNLLTDWHAHLTIRISGIQNESVFITRYLAVNKQLTRYMPTRVVLAFLTRNVKQILLSK